MSTAQTTGSLLLTTVLAAACGAVAFGVAVAIGQYDLSPAVFVGLAVAVVVWIFLMFAMNRPAAAEPAAPVARAVPVAAPVAHPPATARTTTAAAASSAAPVAVAPAGAATRPAALASARGGMPDDLKLIKGVGPKLETLLHRLGFFHFDQIANWTAAEVAWVDDNLEGFKGRVTRDDWVAQARHFAAGGTSAHAEAVKAGKIH